MGMCSFERDHIERELKKRWPNFTDKFPPSDEDGHDKGYEKCWEVYVGLPRDVVDWVYEEIVDGETYKTYWVWRRKS